MVNAGPAVLRGRAVIESMMVDACAIERKTGETTNTTTGVVTPTYSTIYTGKCRIQQPSGVHARVEDVGEQYDRLLRVEVQLPMSLSGLQVGDRITITASIRDADLPGRHLLIKDLAHKTDATARRVRAEEIT